MTFFRRHFFAPRGPLVEALAALALDEAIHGATPWTDLSGTLFLIPSAGACRAFREALVRRTDAAGRGLLPPSILTPGAWLESAAGEFEASPLDLDDAWDAILREAPEALLLPLLPFAEPPLRNAQRLSLRRQLNRVRARLAPAGKDLSSASRLLAAAGVPDPARWSALAELEARLRHHLAGRGLEDPLRTSPDPPATLFAQLARIRLCVDPEPSPQLLAALDAAAAAGVDVRILIAADPSEESDYDDWGRPLPETWSRRPLPSSPGQIHTAADPAALVSTLSSTPERNPPIGRRLALGAANPALPPLLARQLHRVGLQGFSPAGESLTRKGAGPFLRGLVDWLEDGALPAFWDWLHFPAAAPFLDPTAPGVAVLLAKIDELRSQHLPSTLGDLRSFADSGLARLLDAASALVRAYTGRPGFFARLHERFLSLIETEPGLAEDLFANRSSAESFLDLLESVAGLPEDPSANPARFASLLDQLATIRTYSESPPDSLEVLGSEEWIWCAHPALWISGLEEGILPESFRGDPFLNDTVRSALGLPTAATRFEREAYRLHLLCRLRPHPGDLRILHFAVDGEGNPTRPSRLLFLVPDAELPARIRQVFGSPSIVRHRAPGTPPRTRSLPDPGPEALPPKHLSVTDFSAWLRCPFGYYLSRILRTGNPFPFDEINARDFGTLAHECLYQLNTEGADLIAAREIRSLLLDRLAEIARERFGKAPATIPRLQIRALERRLESAAEAVATERAKGWRPIRAEWKIHETGTVFVSDFSIHGTIDCLERNESTGRHRILDYKTGAKGDSPAAAHFAGYPRSVDPATFLPEEAAPTESRSPKRWKNLQLPLYASIVRELLGFDCAMAYFNLPAERSGTGIVSFDPDTLELRKSALTCARAVAAAIRDGRFWPPRLHSPRDTEFAALWVENPESEYHPPGKARGAKSRTP